MTMLWGIASLFQIIGLPGLIILTLSRQLSTSDRILLAFPLSCVLNYLLVLLLSTFGVYTSSILHTIFIIELFVFITIYLVVQKPSWPNPGYNMQSIMGGSNIILDRRGVVLMAFVVLVLAKIFSDFIAQFGQVFNSNAGLDAISIWNHWALEWSTGEVPLDSGIAPQALTALYSMSYVFINEPQIQFFSKVVPGLFVVFAGLSILRLSRLEIHRRTLFLICFVIYFITLYRFYGSSHLFSGFAALPLQYFVIAFAYTTIVAHNNQGGTNVAYALLLLLSVCFASFAALIHPAGLYFALLAPALVFTYLLFSVNLRLRYIVLVVSIILSLIIAGHWYFYKWLILDEVLSFPMLSQDEAWYSRILNSIVLIASKLSWLWIILVYFSLRHHIARRIMLWFLLPCFIFWALYGDYELSHLAMAVPALALVMTFGLRSVSEWLFKRKRLMHLANYSVGFVVLALFIGFIYIGVSDRHGLTKDILYEKSVAKQMENGDPVLNVLMLEFMHQNPAPGKLISHYVYFQYLPFDEISERYIGDGCSSMERFKAFQEAKSFRYILVTEGCHADVVETIKDLVELGLYQHRFSYQDNHLYERLTD